MTGEPGSTAFKALAVGNAHFPADPHRLTTLNGPLNDVDAVCAALSDAETGLFRCQPPLKDATARAMLDTIEEFFTAADRDDCLLFYYSGHGRTDVGGNFYLCAGDTDTASLTTPRVTGADLRALVHHSPALLKVVILDCCYATHFKGGVWPPGYFRGEGSFVLAATRGPGDPLVPDAATPDGLSPFTEAFVEALRRDDLDADDDGYVTAADVSAYITARARSSPAAPFALDRWLGTGIVPLARARRPDGTRPARPAPVAPRRPASPPAVELPGATFPVAVRPGPWPELLPVPADGPPAFHLSRHLVTHAQFRHFLLDPANAAWRPRAARRQRRLADPDYLRHWDGLTYPPGWEHRPVVGVSASAAAAYATWAGQRLGRPLRLPRADEWERAAAAGRCGDWVAEDIAAGRVNFRHTLAEPSEVGEFEAGPDGLADLLGNAWEICLDAAGLPVLRGGAFDTPAGRLLEERPLASRTECRSDAGFRCAC
ncbi:SUMF1/EgtB/PvdO family nonheme iron enzyme [Micromonospora okii]|uniref:SUMF1/EgtB/PvdO family nonheme iron enzyme n=1 Tax=Micromonospora okii TaxID=1182970 RepID=UPI001E47B3A5|nr:SUMF1/EgtB/PvdO family nonheme iron enzyme [Micromonospora okii]